MKEKYIRNLYFNSLKEVIDKLSTLSKNSDLLEKAIADVDKLIKIFNTKIKRHRKTLITEIEIPFSIH